MSEAWNSVAPFLELSDAVKANDRTKVRELTRTLIAYVYRQADAFDEERAKEILNVLRRRRLFEELRQVADAFLSNSCSTFDIRKYYAQALLDLGYLAAAENVLHQLRDDAAPQPRDANEDRRAEFDPEESWAEACGLLGRLHKDRYVNANAPRVVRNQLALNRAISCYYDCYAADEQLSKFRHWQGINAVALARLARRDRVPVDQPFDVMGTAETILEEIEVHQRLSDGPIDIWATAIAMEACVALNRREDAYRWAKSYADPSRERVDAFEIASTLRQLQEVWKLKVDDEPGSVLIPLLRTRLIELAGFDLKLGETETLDPVFLSKQADSLEKRFGGHFLSFRLYSEGVSRARAIARIGPSAEEHFGTGFLVDGADLDPRLKDQRLLVTCDHVVSETDFRALRPNRAVVTFRAQGQAIRTCDIHSVVWSSPEGVLDVCVLRLDDDVSDLPTIPGASVPPSAEEQRVLIFGHAEGGTLAFSLGDNRVVGQNERYLQYRAPTVGGSSGSPVFNVDWDLVAVHHRGGYALKRLDGDGTHEANQGSLLFAIRSAMNDQAELG